MESATHRVQDPLSDVTRKVRRNLIVLSTVSLIMIYAGLVPSKIDSLGINFEESHQAILMDIVLFSLVYLLVSFSIYAISDFLKWKIALLSLAFKEQTSELEEYVQRKYGQSELKTMSENRLASPKDMGDLKINEIKQELSEKLKRHTSLYRGPVAAISLVRGGVDFLAPILLAGFTVYKLIGY